MRKVIVMGTFLLLSLGLVIAEEHNGIIKKIDGNKMTILVGKKKDADGVEKTFTIDAKVKVAKAKKSADDPKKFEAGDALEGGIKNEAVKEGAFARITTDKDDKVITHILIGGGGKKKAQ
jgi:hypothetical protein